MKQLSHPAFNTLIVGVAIPLALTALFHLFAEEWRWEQQLFHSLLEGVGSFAALALAIFILIMRRHQLLQPIYLWVATTLIAMGLLDGFHASVPPGTAFVWLHSLATFFGGLIFALILLPEAFVLHPWVSRLPAGMAIVVLMISVSSLLDPSWLPAMTDATGFTWLAIMLNLIGGLGFLLAWAQLIWKSTFSSQEERLVLATHCLLFGVAGLLFSLSVLWDATWWLWHLLRFLAYLVILVFFLRLYEQSMRRIRESELNYRTLVQNTPGTVYCREQDSQGTLCFISEQVQALTGYDAQELLDKQKGGFSQLIPKTEAQRIGSEITAAIQAGRPYALEYPLFDRDGRIRWAYDKGQGHQDRNGKMVLTGVILDITEEKAAQRRLQLLGKAVETCGEAIVITTADATIVEVNPAYEQITGFCRDEVIGRNPRIAGSGLHDQMFYRQMWHRLVKKRFWQGEILDRRKDGEIFAKWLTIAAITDQADTTTHYVGIFQDITEQKKVRDQLHQLAFYDRLTGLPNRTLFHDHFSHALSAARHHQETVTLFYFDLDHFKWVNDTLGHRVGDQLLIEVATRMKQAIGDTNLFARLGGDEFALVLDHQHHPDKAIEMANRIIEHLTQPFQIQGQMIHIGCSIGIAVFPDDGDDWASLTKHADLAMYQAKQEGRNTYRFFSPKLHQDAVHRLELENALRTALEQKEFVVYYQPKVCLDNHMLIGMEALLRWKRPGVGLVRPDDFIPLAEETGLIIPIGYWVLAEVCQQIKSWRLGCQKTFAIAVNLSPRQFREPNFIQTVTEIITNSGVNPACLEFEVTEGTLMEEVDQAIERMTALRQLGVTLAIDDFGTGYSSLAYLKKLPIDTLKIDRSFIRELTKTSEDNAIVDATIALANRLHLRVVAEGVELPEQVDYLTEQGCDEVQGYFFGLPRPSDDYNADKLYCWLTHSP